MRSKIHLSRANPKLTLLLLMQQYKKKNNRINSRQLSSSLLSPQLFTLSQRFDTGTHTRSLRQRNCLVGGHRNLTDGPTERRIRRRKIINQSQNWRKTKSPKGETRQISPHSAGFSSELSPQSSSPSHIQLRGLHSVLLHWNSSWKQCLSTETPQQERGHTVFIPLALQTNTLLYLNEILIEGTQKAAHQNKNCMFEREDISTDSQLDLSLKFDLAILTHECALV